MAIRLSGNAERGISGWSGHAAISDDGRLVVFQSAGTQLVAEADENGTLDDIYAFDTTSRVLRRVSVDSAGRQPREGSSFAPCLSGDGRYVAFTSTADLDGLRSPANTGARGVPVRRVSQVYVRDLQLGITTRVSVGSGGSTLNDRSYESAISRDGRFIAFVSEATDLTRGDRNRSPDVFVTDAQDRSTVLISRSARGGTANGPSGSPAISADGRVVVFQSSASDLVCSRRCPPALDDVNLLPDIFLFDRAADRMMAISGDPTGGWAEESVAPQLDAAGSVVVFTSRHPIDALDVRHDFDLFIRQRTGSGDGR
jgi:Tol biopolymer transport system component